MHYLRLLLIALWLLAPAVHADERDLSRLQEIRTLGFDFATNLLLYYAPYEKYPDPHLRQIYNDDSRRILQLSQQLQGGKQLSDSVLRIQALTRELEQQPMDAMQLSYPSWLNPILEEHARLDQTASALYAGMEPPSARTRQVNALSVLMSQLLLLYQVKAYQSLSTAALEMSDQDYGVLDGRITQALAGLDPSAFPDGKLKKLERNYGFVRTHILDATQRGAVGSVSFYLRGNIKTLSQLAGE